MAGIQGFHHVALWTRDFDRSVRFYTEVLGLAPKYQWGFAPSRSIILRCGPHGHVEIFERPDSPEAPPEARLLHFALQTDDVEGLYARALAAGATARIGPKEVQFPNAVPEGPDMMRVRLAFLNGLDGEIIELFDDRSA